MIVDTSALIAILRSEPDAALYARALTEAQAPRMSAASVLETEIVLMVLDRARGRNVLQKMLDRSRIEVVDFTQEQARLAREAYWTYGRGSGHPARLNFGDCFAYALAKLTSEPLLFKGGDFALTDIVPQLSTDPTANC